MDSFYDDPFGLGPLLGFDLLGFGSPSPPRTFIGLTQAQLAEAEEAHQRWLKVWPIIELELSIQRRFDRCCHR